MEPRPSGAQKIKFFLGKCAAGAAGGAIYTGPPGVAVTAVRDLLGGGCEANYTSPRLLQHP